jgi:outer membrane protein insertion porin family
MRWTVFFICAMVLPAASIRSVQVLGTGRIFALETKAGGVFDADAVSRDVRALWSTQAFDDMRVERASHEDGSVDVVFHAKEKQKLYLDKVEFEPRSAGRTVELPPGALIDEGRARALARDLEKQLRQEGFAQGRVHFQIVPVGYKRAKLHFDVDRGDRYTVWNTLFAGATGVSAGELERALRATRVKPVLWGMFHSRPAFSEEAVEGDAQRLRSFYTGRGYFDARVVPGEVSYQGERVTVHYQVDAGERRELTSPPAAMCGCLFQARRAADREGRTEFTAKLRVSLDDAGKATVLPALNEGEPWYVRRISFQGNHKYSDSVLRGALVLAEGEPFDQTRLSRSLVRLGRLGIVEPPTEKNIAVIKDAATRTVAVEIRVKEIAGGRWSLSGPAGTFAMGGSLQGSVMSRLPGWGSGLWELSTYVASVSMTGFGDPLSKLIFAGKIKSFRPYFALQRPFVSSLGWQSGFTVAPQLNPRSHAELYGLTQVQGRIRNLLLSDQAAEPPLVIPVEYGDSRAAGMVLCEERISPWRHVRGGAVMALEFVAAARSF